MHPVVRILMQSESTDWQTWCSLGGVDPNLYTDLAAVVASSTAMNTLANSSAAVEYMISRPEIGLSVTGSAVAKTALDSSSPIIVPLMTSATAPSGVVSVDSTYNGYTDYFAFSRNTSNFWISALSSGVHYIQYQFTSAMWPYRFELKPYDATNGGAKNLKLQGSNNGTDFTDLSSTFTAVKNSLLQSFSCDLANTTRYQYLRIRFADSYAADGRIGISNVQFYGK